ncbi:MAG: hypothetical protein IJ094_07980 [Bacilli bacterium]|nr:hypothetical protein [Bacilli bacterium]
MYNTSKIPSKIIETELSIRLLEYLKRNNTIDDGMYNYCINKLVRKIEIEKNKIDDNYMENDSNYKILV